MTRISLADIVQPMLETDELILPASQFQASYGSAVSKQIEGAHFWSFPDTGTTLVGFSSIRLPSSWTEFSADLITINETTDTGDVRWEFRLGDTIEGTVATVAPILVGGVFPANEYRVISTYTVINTRPVSDVLHWVGVARMGSDAGDTKPGNAGFIAAILRRVS